MTSIPSPRLTNGRFRSQVSVFDRPESWEFTYDPDVEHPEVPFGYGMTIQLVWLTPELAAEWKEKRGEFQRNLKEGHLSALMEDHQAGRVRLNGEPVIFDWEDRLVNGQHRVEVVIRTGKPVFVTVIRGVSPDVYTTYDISAKRTGADALRSVQIANSVLVSSAAILFERYQRDMIGFGKLTITAIGIKAVVDIHSGLVTSASYATGMKGFSSLAAMTMCHYVLCHVDADKASEFFEMLGTGANMDVKSPILKLRNLLFNQPVHRDETVRLVFKGWNLWRKKRTGASLKLNQDEGLEKPV